MKIPFKNILQLSFMLEFQSIELVGLIYKSIHFLKLNTILYIGILITFVNRSVFSPLPFRFQINYKKHRTNTSYTKQTAQNTHILII